MAYCPKCGNTGLLLDGSICECKTKLGDMFEGFSCLDIPEQYQRVTFNTSLVRLDMPSAYAVFLQKIYTEVTTLKWRYRNLALCSPAGHSKTILAYTCIKELFRRGIVTFPLFDIREIKRIMLDMDYNTKQTYQVDEPIRLLTAPYLFVRIPVITDNEVYETVANLLDRRVRRGGSTIFLYNGSWAELVYNDKRHVLSNILGDGTYGTIENSTWRVVQ